MSETCSFRDELVWNRWTLSVGALLAVACVAPFWVGCWLPMLDLPQHLGLVTAIHHYSNPAWDFERFYTLDLRPLPYWGFYLPTHLLLYLMPVTTAARVVLSCYALAVPWGLWTLLGAFGRDRRLALLGVPLVFNTNLFMGFVSFVVALPIWLFAVAAAECHLSAPSRDVKRAATAGSLAALLYLCHGHAFVLYLCVLVYLWIAHAPPWRAMLVYVPAWALFGYWLVANFLAPGEAVVASQHLVRIEGVRAAGEVIFNSFGKNLMLMGNRLFNVHRSLVDNGLFALWLGLLLALLGRRINAWRQAPADPETTAAETTARRARVCLKHWRVEMLTGGLLLSYFIAPMDIGMQWYVNPRHLIFVALLLPAAVVTPNAKVFTGHGRWLLVAAFLVALLLPTYVCIQAHRYDSHVGPLHEVIEASSRGGRTLALIFERSARGPLRQVKFVHYAGYIQATSGGDLGISFAGLPSIPVRYRQGMQAPAPSEWAPHRFVWRDHARHYTRILVYNPPTGWGAKLAQHARKVTRAGLWRLYELGHALPQPGR